MRTNNLLRAVILIFLLSAIFVSAVGCNNLPPEELPNDTETDKQDPSSSGQNAPTDSELAMLKKWEDVIVDVNADVKSVEVRKYTIQPAYSSIITPIKVFTLEDKIVIEDLLNIVRKVDVSFEDYKIDENEINEYLTSYVGQEKIEIILKDSGETVLFGLCLYENGDIAIIEAREITETKKTYRYTYRVYFDDSNSDVFAAIASFYENNIVK